MRQVKNISTQLKRNLRAIPVCLTALVLWAFIGGWYIAVAPPNLAGADNIGIVLSIFGICLFVTDRVAVFWFNAYSKVFFFPTWTLGLIFIVWGLLEWLHSFSSRYAVVFLIHWSVLLAAMALASFWSGRRRQKTE